MRRWLLVSSVTLAVCTGLAQQADIRVEVNLVRVVTTVKNAAGQPIGTLSKEDFTILDNNVPQQVAVFERRTEQPLSVALLIDTSGSTAKDLKYEVESVSRFLHALFAEGNPNDTVALFSFNYQVVIHNHFTRNTSSIEHSLHTLRGEAGTSLYDAIYLASAELERRDGRRVMVIVTDGGDTTSTKNFHAALDAAQRADTVIYPILVVPITNDAGRNLGGERALDSLAAGTGARVFQPMGASELDQAFTQILRDLRTQYLVGYYPRNLPPDTPKFHPVRVELSRKDLRATTRTGYYGDALH